MRYLDPKADLTFKRVFGEHIDLLISFLNALLPFDAPGDCIVEAEYLPSELVPQTPLRKNSIVDVRCRDNWGRQFIVEMQMVWTPEFQQRVLFNASKAYVRQLGSGEAYELLQPVYSLNLVNTVFEPGLGDEFYHYYRMVHVEHTDRVIDGLHLVFIELPKFKPQSYSAKRLAILWLRYLTEIGDNTSTVPADLLADPQISKAVGQLEESAFTEAQLLGYEKFWDSISVEKTLYNSAERRGMAAGMAKGLAQGMAEGLAQGMAKGLEQGIAKGLAQGMAEGLEQGKKEGGKQQSLFIARKMKTKGMPEVDIAEMTGLTIEEIRTL